MRKFLSAFLVVSMVFCQLLPTDALALSEAAHKRELASENVKLGEDAVGMMVRAEYPGFVFTEPDSDAKKIGTTAVGCYYDIIDYQQNWGTDAYFLIEFGSKVGWVLVNKVKVSSTQIRWGSWSSWKKTKVTPNATCQVETKKVKETETVYKYSRYVLSFLEDGSLHEEYQTKTSKTRITDGTWFNEEISKKTVTNTYYRYRKGTVIR